MSTPRAKRYRLKVEGIPPGPNARLHHMERYRQNKEFLEQVGLGARDLRNKHPEIFPAQRAHVNIAFTLPRGKFMDPDNLYACAKPLLDGIKGVLIVDDSPAHITLEVMQMREDFRGALIEVRPIPQESPSAQASPADALEGGVVADK